MLKTEGRKTFLIATDDMEKKEMIERFLNKKFKDSMVFHANDRTECMQKMKNVTPRVFITDYVLQKAPPGQMVDFVISDDEFKKVPVIILSPLPEKENYLDEIVTGKIQFLGTPDREEELFYAVTRALNFSAQTGSSSDFIVRYLATGETLMKQGDAAKQVFIVKSGKLKAVQELKGAEPRFLGEVNSGEFVGEMAYFNGEPRNATVIAVENCELIEIPVGTFEKVLFQRPAWSKKVLETMSKRLRKTMG